MVRDIEWTGERCVPWLDAAEVIYEHYHRYCFARRLVRDLDVLDVACGEGFGPDILSGTARSVLGVDIDAATIQHASLNYAKPTLSFQIGDMLNLGILGDSRFDAVVCFEAIEHVVDHEAVISGIKNVLKAPGVLLISTPDKPVYNERNSTGNPFHAHELESAEFDALLRRQFAHVSFWGQSPCSGSVLVERDAPEMSELEVINFSRQNEEWLFRPAQRPTYLVAIASDAPLGQVANSLLLDDGAELVEEAWGHFRRVSDELTGVSARLEQSGTERRALLAELTSLRERLELADAEVDVCRLECASAQTRLGDEMQLSAELYRELRSLRSSFAMRMWQQYKVTRDWVLPKGSVARDSYDRLARAILSRH